MRQELIGLILAAALIGGLFFAATHRAARHEPAQAAAAAARTAAASIKPGFVGVRRIGAWQVACASSPVMVSVTKPAAAKPAAAKPKVASHTPALPLSLGGGEKGEAAAPAAGPSVTSEPSKEKLSLGRCRATQAFRHKGATEAEVALAVNLRIVGAAPGRVGVFVRLPAKGAKKGQTLQIRLAKAGFKLPIVRCGPSDCLAVAFLEADGARLLQTSPAAELLLPPDSTGRRAGVRLAVDGLGPALEAVRRAQT